MKIQAQKYYFSPKDIKFVVSKHKKLLESGEFMTMGKYCLEFENRFAKYIGVKHASATNSGTSALEAIFIALGLEGKEVVVTTNTFAATIFAIIKAGATPVFVDVAEDMAADPEDVERKINDKTGAVVAVHIGGMVSPSIKKLAELCRRRKIHLVEDACQAHGSGFEGQKAGTFGVAAAFSFFSTKLITTGEGGMVVTNDKDVIEKVNLLKNQAKEENDNYHKVVGDNWRMSEIQAIMGLCQLANIQKVVQRRQKIAKIYDSLLATEKKLKILSPQKGMSHNYYKYILFLDSIVDREVLEKKMKSEYGVSLSGYVYKLPCHLQPVFKKYANGSLPFAEKMSKIHIALPVYYQLSDKEARYVATSLINCIKK